MTADPALSLRLYEAMLRIRRTEERIADRYADQQMRCPTHLCIGQEAIAVGVCAALEHQDKVFSNHRAHGHYLAKGGDISRMIAEFYGKSDGCCGGRGGSMHLIDNLWGFWVRPHRGRHGAAGCRCGLVTPASEAAPGVGCLW